MLIKIFFIVWGFIYSLTIISDCFDFELLFESSSAGQKFNIAFSFIFLRLLFGFILSKILCIVEGY